MNIQIMLIYVYIDGTVYTDSSWKMINRLIWNITDVMDNVTHKKSRWALLSYEVKKNLCQRSFRSQYESLHRWQKTTKVRRQIKQCQNKHYICYFECMKQVSCLCFWYIHSHCTKDTNFWFACIHVWSLSWDLRTEVETNFVSRIL